MGPVGGGASPVLHVTAATMCALVVAGYLKILESGEVVSRIGDRVIRSSGYDTGDGSVAAFWTSQAIDVRLTTANTASVHQARTNTDMRISEGMGQAGIVPCAIVKVVAE